MLVDESWLSDPSPPRKEHESDIWAITDKKYKNTLSRLFTALVRAADMIGGYFSMEPAYFFHLPPTQIILALLLQ